jgi:TolB-like protein/Flp pilus assembly protein TadD
MKPGTSEKPLRRVLIVGREYLTHWAIAGAIIALTGFAPEHWIADLLSQLSIPESLRHGWLLRASDIRTSLVAIGVAIVAWDVLRRSRLQKQAALHDHQASDAATLYLPDKPSIAVLPFQNMSGDPEQEYFSDGVVEDIITALSRFRHLFVIARNSSFVYKGRAVDVKQVGRELGVRYVLEGSLRKAGNHVRISGQLIDALTGAHLWADRFDDTLEGIFDLQDQITAKVVGAITPKLEQAEIERAKRKPTESLDAYDYYLRGMASFYQQSNEAQTEALRLFQKAIVIDPNFALVHGMAAWCHAHRKANGWMIDFQQETAETARLARRAVELGKDDAVALASGGFALAYVCDDLDGPAFVERALVLNPNLASAWNLSGRLKIWLGEPETAIDHLARAMRLSPLDPLMHWFQHTTGLAHFLAGRDEEALSWEGKALRERPNFIPALRVLTASNALAGRLEDAGKAMARLRENDPGLRISNLKNYTLVHRPKDFARYAEGLRKAGLPE